MLSFPTIFANSRRRNIHVPPTRHSPRTLCGRPANPFLRLRPRNPLPATPALRATLPRSPACSALCAATRKSPRHKTRPDSPRTAYPRTARAARPRTLCGYFSEFPRTILPPARPCPGSLFRPCHAPGQFFSIVRARSAVPRRLPAEPTQPPHGPGRSAAAPQTPFFDSGPGIRSPRLRPCAQHSPAVPLDPRSAPRRAKGCAA